MVQDSRNVIVSHIVTGYHFELRLEHHEEKHSHPPKDLHKITPQFKSLNLILSCSPASLLTLCWKL